MDTQDTVSWIGTPTRGSLKRRRASSIAPPPTSRYMVRYTSRSSYGRQARRRYRAARRPRMAPVRRQVARLTGLGIGTTTTMNVHRDKVHVYQKSFVANISAGAGVGVSSVTSFDPSGTLATYAGTALNFGGGAIALPDWGSFVGLYDQYKINKIRVTMVAQPNGAVAGATLDTNPVDMTFRYCYDPAFTATTANLYELQSVKRHLFSTANPSVSFDIIPYMQRVVYDPGAALATTGYEVVPFGWVDVDNPALCWGAVYIATVLPAGIVVRFDVTMDIAFKYNR